MCARFCFCRLINADFGCMYAVGPLRAVICVSVWSAYKSHYSGTEDTFPLACIPSLLKEKWKQTDKHTFTSNRDKDMITAIHGEINRPLQKGNHLDEQLCTSLTVSLSFCWSLCFEAELVTEKHKHKETTCQLTHTLLSVYYNCSD